MDNAKSWNYICQIFEQQNGNAPSLALFHAPVKDVLEWGAVEELGPESWGPQRGSKDARVEQIKKFLTDKRNSIPTAIVVAFKPGRVAADLIPLPEAYQHSRIFQLIITPENSVAAAGIIDGQHRLLGISQFNPDTHVPVVALLDADDVEQAFQFLVINNKAAKVPVTHTKALLARMQNTELAERLRTARLALDVQGIKDVDLINSDPDSPFFESVVWSTTPTEKQLVQATALEASLAYLEGLELPELADRDVRRGVFLAIWRQIKSDWIPLWQQGSRLLSKVGIICMTRFVADMISSWADNDELQIEITDLVQISSQTSKIVGYMNAEFWTTPWAERASGGFDTQQGRERITLALTQLYRNGRRASPWYKDIAIIDQTAVVDGDQGGAE